MCIQKISRTLSIQKYNVIHVTLNFKKAHDANFNNIFAY